MEPANESFADTSHSPVIETKHRPRDTPLLDLGSNVQSECCKCTDPRRHPSMCKLVYTERLAESKILGRCSWCMVFILDCVLIAESR